MSKERGFDVEKEKFIERQITEETDKENKKEKK